MSELILLFLYIGYMALRGAIDDTSKADKASAVLAMVGAINVPIIHFSVEWWSFLASGPNPDKRGGAGHGSRHVVSAIGHDISDSHSCLPRCCCGPHFAARYCIVSGAPAGSGKMVLSRTSA